jgi:hypothetical protein
LFFQTEEAEFTTGCLQRLAKRDLFPDARVVLVCHEEDREIFQSVNDVEKAITWGPGRRVAQTLKIWKEIRHLQPDVNCAAFTGRPVFRPQKFAYFLLGARRKLAFNANQDAYRMSLQNFTRVFRREPFHPGTKRKNKVLILETASSKNMLSATETVQKPDVVPNAEITLFCREDKATLFGDFTTITYSKGSVSENLRALQKLFTMKPDVLVAVFSGSKIYSKHRLLFWILPARSRLAFNENLDCLYLDRTNFHLLLREPSGTPDSLLRNGVRGILFLPRFLYLLAWWTSWKLGFLRAK